MTAKDKALNLMDDIYIGLAIKNHSKAKEIVLYIAQSHIIETLELEKLRFWKEVIIEIEKL